MSCELPSGYEGYTEDKDGHSDCSGDNTAGGSDQWYFTVKNETSGPICFFYSDATGSDPGSYFSLAAGECTKVSHSWDHVTWAAFSGSKTKIISGKMDGADGAGCCAGSSGPCKDPPCGFVKDIVVKPQTGWGKYGKYLAYGGIALAVILAVVLIIVIWRRSKSSSNKQLLEMIELLN